MNKVKRIKIVMLGDTGVGKTSILKQFVSGKFDNKSAPTKGADFICKDFDLPNSKITAFFQIWDTAGQEKYRSLALSYYRDASATLIVFDITDEKTFEGAKVWIDQVNENGEKNIIKILIGNKSDRLDKPSMNYEVISDYANKCGIKLFISSAKENINIEPIFYYIAEIMTGVSKEKIRRSKSNYELKIDSEKNSFNNCC